MAKYQMELEIYEGRGGELRKEGGRVISPSFAKEGICAWMYRGDGQCSFRAGQRFAYPEDTGRMCSWLVASLSPFIQALRYGGNLHWTYAGGPYAKEMDPESVTTEFVRCPDPTASGIVVKIIRTRLPDDTP